MWNDVEKYKFPGSIFLQYPRYTSDGFWSIICRYIRGKNQFSIMIVWSTASANGEWIFPVKG